MEFATIKWCVGINIDSRVTLYYVWYKAALVGTVQTQPVRDTEAICVGGSWVWLARLFYGVLSAITCCYLAVVHLATERLPS